MSELVYVDVEVYRSGDTEFTDALLDWSDDLWVFPGRPDLSDVTDATEEVTNDESRFKTPALCFTIKPLPNPAYVYPEGVGFIDLLQSEASDIDLFEVDAHERWWPILQRRMVERPNANQVSFYAVYAVTETTHKDENGTSSNVEFEFVGELDFARLPLVQA